MSEMEYALAEAVTAGGEYEALSEELELESIRYSRALPEEEEAKRR